MPVLASLVATLLRLRARACVVLACVAAMLCAASIALANTTAETKTRVWDFSFAAPLNIRLNAPASSRLHRENQSLQSEQASVSLLARKGPPATLELAQQVQGKIPQHAQTVSVLETAEGPTLVAGGVSDLSATQQTVAEQLGLTVVTGPGLHAEMTVIQGAAQLGLTPTVGVATNNVCSGICAPVIQEIGGYVSGKFFGF